MPASGFPAMPCDEKVAHGRPSLMPIRIDAAPRRDMVMRDVRACRLEKGKSVAWPGVE